MIDRIYATQVRKERLPFSENFFITDLIFSSLGDGRQLSANQLDFVNLIIDHLTQCGGIRPEQLYSSPFTDRFSLGPNAVFKESQALKALVATLEKVRRNAAGA